MTTRRPGRATGQLMNPRDCRGWMIPREGTKRRAVYDALCAGLSRVDLGLSKAAWDQHRRCIVSAEKVWAWRRAGSAL